MKSLLIIFICVISVPIFGQDKTIDSLKLAFKKAKHDTAKCSILNRMIEKENDLETVKKISNSLVKICEDNFNKTNLPSIEIKCFKKQYSKAIVVIAQVAELQNDEWKALEYYKKGITLLEEIKDYSNLAITLNNIAIIYSRRGNIPLALEYNYKSLKIKETLNDKLGIAYSLSNIGLIYFEQNELVLSLKYHLKSLKIREEINDKKGIVQSLNNLGTIYGKQKKLNKALTYFNRALIIAIAIDDKTDAVFSYFHIASTYLKKGENENALVNYNNGLKLSESNNYNYGTAICLAEIGYVYIKQKNYTKALAYVLKSMALSSQLGYPKEIARSAMSLNIIYKATGNYKLALENYELYIKMHDSISSQETRKSTIKNQLKYEYEKKASADYIKVSEEKKLTTVKLKQEKTQRYYLYSGLGLTALFGIFMFSRFRITQKQKNVIEEQKLIVEKQKHLVDEKQKEILDSIRYAKRIQQSLMPTEKYFDRILKNKKS